MSVTSKKVKNNSFIVAIVVDLLMFLVSFFVNTNLSNSLLLKIVFFCYCFRFELIFFFVLALFTILFTFFLKKIGTVNTKISLGMILLFVVAALFSIKPAKQYAKARYYYINNKYYQDESQKRFLDKAQKNMDSNEWKSCVQNLSRAKELYPEGYYTTEIDWAIDEAIFYMAYGERLYETYIKPVSGRMSLNKFKCAQTLSGLYPDRYEREFLKMCDSVSLAINTYPQLYKEVSSGNYKKCRELILRYGWCWFEPTLCDKLSYDNEIVMEWLNQYFDAGQIYDDQSRMVKIWFCEDSIPAIIQ